MGIQQETGRGSDPGTVSGNIRTGSRRTYEDLTLELFQETFGQVPGAHFHDKWVHYYNKNLLMMAAYFRGEEENGQKFCDMVTRQVERYTQNRRRTG